MIKYVLHGVYFVLSVMVSWSLVNQGIADISLFKPNTLQRSLQSIAQLISDKEYDNAEKQLQRLLDKNPKDAQAHFLLSLIFRFQKKYGDAARELVEATMHDERILVPSQDLLLELGWELPFHLAPGEKYSFIPRYRLDDEIKIRGTLKQSVFWEENNQLFSRKGGFSIDAAVYILTNEKNGLISAEFLAHSFKHWGKLPATLPVRKRIGFTFSPIFGYVAVSPSATVSEEQLLLLEPLLKALFPPFPAKYVKMGEVCSLSEWGPSGDLYVGAARIVSIDDSEGQLELRTLHFKDNVYSSNPEELKRSITTDILTGLPMKIELNWTRESSAHRKLSGNFKVKLDRIRMKRGKVELPLYPTMAMLVSSTSTPTSEKAQPKQDLYHSMVYKLPELDSLNRNRADSAETTESKSNPPARATSLPAHNPQTGGTRSAAEKETSSSMILSEEQIEEYQTSPPKSAEPLLKKSPTPEPSPNSNPQVVPKYDDDRSPTPTEASGAAAKNQTPAASKEQQETKERGDSQTTDMDNENDYSGMIVMPKQMNDGKKDTEENDVNLQENEQSMGGGETISVAPIEEVLKYLNSLKIPPPPVPHEPNGSQKVANLQDIDALKAMKKQHPRDAELLVQLGKAYLIKAYSLKPEQLLERGEYMAKAKDEFNLALNVSRKNVLLLNEIGRAWYAIGMYDEALNYFQDALSRGRQYESYAGAALCYAQKGGNYIKAVVLAKKALQKKKDEQTYFALGWIFYKKKDYKWALENFDKALSIKEENTIRFYRGLALLRSHRVQETIKALRQVATQDTGTLTEFAKGILEKIEQ